MALTFNDICVFLEKIEVISIRCPRLSSEGKKAAIRRIIRNWFSEHRLIIDSPDTNGGALLSTLFPHRRKDRVYGFRPKMLSQKLIKLLNFSHEQRELMCKWPTTVPSDLGMRTANAMRRWDGTVRKKQPILLERVDRLLAQLAARHRFSDPTIQKKRDCDIDTDAELKDIFIRIESVEAKWLVRLLLRQYCTIELDEDFVLEQYHFLLPDLLKFQNDFDVASSLLLQDMSTFPSVPDPASKRAMRIEAAEKLKPTVGVKVGRPTFYKAWVSHYNPSINDHVH